VSPLGITTYKLEQQGQQNEFQGVKFILVRNV